MARRSLGANYRKLFAATTISNLGDGVSLIAYPWLATALTRNPLLIALVAVVQRLPWLLFTLPAGVITDRNDRRRLMVGANLIRFVITALVALALLARGGALPAPDEVDSVVGTEWFLYLVLLFATLLLGTCEVLHDNSAQTFLPAVVGDADLEQANGQMYSAEIVANQFAGPPLASVLLASGFVLPILFDAGSFAVAAGLVFSIVATRTFEPPPATAGRTAFKRELAEGFRWLWHHPLLRTFAITLGFLNMLSQVFFATIVLFGQEVLHTSAFQFGLMMTLSAVGGVIGGWLGSRIAKRIGAGAAVQLTLWSGGVCVLLAGFSSQWLIVAVLLGLTMFTGILWNVITVSLRQAVIPDRLLGRVNSVYRFFGWGMMPIGSLIGGALVAVLDGPLSREWALRMPWIVAGAGQLVLALVVVRSLSSSRIDAVRAGGKAEDPAGRGDVSAIGTASR